MSWREVNTGKSMFFRGLTDPNGTNQTIMAKRSERIGTKRPRHIDRAPYPPNCLAILDEMASDLGLELAMLARQVFLAAATNISGRPLFTGRTPSHVVERRLAAMREAPGDLQADLRTLAAVNSRTPVDGSTLATACLGVSEWARTAGFLRTATAFAEAGAAINPAQAEAAFIAGRANRMLNQVWRGELYYRRAIRLAYRSLDWDIYIRAQLGYGRLMADTGRRVAALTAYQSAASVAETQGLEWLAAQTYHDLLVLHFDSGDLDRALEYAFRAIRTYPVHNERFPLAVHDLAFVLLSRSYAAEAFPMLKAVIRAPLEAEHQLLVTGTLARAAGQLGQRDLVLAVESVVLEAAPQHQFHAAFATMNLGFGMWAVGEWTRSAALVEQALELAETTEVPYVLTHAADYLRQIKARESAPPPVACSGDLAEELARLVQILDQRVAAWHTAPSWNARLSAGQSGPRTLGPV
jgi:tetratricopeptide (TPR) repeat protein